MSKIIRLDPHMANLIAAGEVVERPSSVVKELVENAIDANATIITVSLHDAGTKMIQVMDNGSGMDKTDAIMAFERHATSKIFKEDDLYRIQSLGFRGEALPSIAAVSKVTLKTSTDGVGGILLELHAGKIINQVLTPATKGTTITVNHLFYNTPARFKHVQSQSTELSYSIDYMNKCALAYPNIRFTLSHNDKTILQTTGSNNLLEVIASTYGYFVAKHMVSFHQKESHFHINGFASDNSITRSNRYGITILVNGRIIKNRSLFYAVIDAYQNILVTNKFPIVVVSITVDPSLIDVNIHPSKFEIKLTDEEILKSLITSTIRNVLSHEILIPEINHSIDHKIVNQKVEFVSSPGTDNQQPQSILDSFAYAMQSDEDPVIVHLQEKQVTEYTQKPTVVQERIDSYLEEKQNNNLPPLEYIGQFHGTYLLAQDEKELYLIDQHAAMERVMYEKISQYLSNEKTSIYELLIPFQYHFSLMEYDLVLEQKQALLAMGIQMEDFGTGSILIRSIPSWIPQGLEEEFIRDIIEKNIMNKKATKQELLDEIAKSLSCKKSIKANMYVTTPEVKELLRELNNTKNPYTCPHGRPVIVRVSSYEIEKWFKRVV